MKNPIPSVKQRVREIVYLLVSLPVSIILFSLVMLGFANGAFVPLAILIFLFLLTAMEKVAAFEIRRANRFLGTDFQVAPNWFKNPLFSWSGVKERITSLRSWMAIAYVFVVFGWSIFSFALISFGIAGFAVILVASGAIVLSNFTRTFNVVDGGDQFEGSLRFFGASGDLRLEFGDGSDSGVLVYNVDSWWSIAIGVVLVALALWIFPRNVRTMAQMVEGLLSGGFYSTLEMRIKRLYDKQAFSNLTVNGRVVREAMADEVARPELADLSPREREILALMAEGKSNAGIAKALYITEGSVEKHISSILSKLGLNVEVENHRRVLAVLTYLGLNK